MNSIRAVWSWLFAPKRAAYVPRMPTQDEWVKARYLALKADCTGFNDPEERCPRNPEDCVCWWVRNDVERRRSLTGEET